MGCSGNIVGAPIQLAEQTGQASANLSIITNSSTIRSALAAVPDTLIDAGRVSNASDFRFVFEPLCQFAHVSSREQRFRTLSSDWELAPDTLRLLPQN